MELLCTVIGSCSAVVLGVEVIYEMMLTPWRDRKVPSLTLIQHKSRASPAKARYEIGETESEFQPSMTPLNVLCSSVEALLWALDNHSSEQCDSWHCQMQC